MTLTGSNRYALKRKLGTVREEFVARHGEFGLEQLDGDEVALERMAEAVQSLPFLASGKLVILTQPSAHKAFAESPETLLADVPDTTEVYIIEPRLDKRTTYYKWLKKHTDFQEFAELDERALASWAVEYAKEQGSSLSLANANYLVNRVGANQQRLSNELTKLCLNTFQAQSLEKSVPSSGLGIVSREVIDELTEAVPQSKIFDLLDAAFRGQTKQATKLYQEQRALRVEPQEILAMIGWQLRQVALAKTAGSHDVVREGKVSPYSATKAKSIASRLTASKLKQLVRDITALDARSKQASIDLDEALQNYILNLA